MKVTVVSANGPSYWPSVSIIRPEFDDFLRSRFSNFSEVDILGSDAVPKSDLLIFPAGSVQIATLLWLKKNFLNPKKRPPAIFFWGGEGAKLGYHIAHFFDIFRSDDQWVVGCDAEKKLLDHWFPENRRTHIMYHPIAPQFRPLQSESEKRLLRRRLNLPIQQPLMLYAGRLSEQKNILSLLDLLERHPKIGMVVCGDIDSVGVPHLSGVHPIHVASHLTEQIGHRKLSNRIRFFPFQSQQQLRQTMQSCDYQVSLSAHYGEDFGYSIAQGLYCGLRTILSDWGGHKNWKGFVPPQSIQFVPLDWSMSKPIGQPLLPEKIRLPSQNLNPDFRRLYKSALNQQFTDVLNSCQTVQSHNISIKIRPELLQFWKNFEKVPRRQMFESPDDRLFKVVISAYGNK